MSVYLWKHYLEDDIHSFRQLLAAARYSGPTHNKGHGAGGNVGSAGASPGKALATSPSLRSKSRSHQEPGHATRGNKGLGQLTLTRADINSKDAHGVSLLHHMASSTAGNASSYALAYLELPFLDLYIQDLESGWTSLHRALYFGNVTIARALMERDNKDATGITNTPGAHSAGGLIKIKDREGNSPFDVFGATVTNRILRHGSGQATIDSGNEDEEEDEAHGNGVGDEDGSHVCMDGDELYTFGSNKNFTLGFGDEDDRQFPERITLKRPEHLLRRLCAEHQQQSRRACQGGKSPQNEEPEFFSSESIPALVRYRAIKILDVQLSKFHTAVLTTDPEANLYVCGFGPGGRLGTGDETTRFNFTCVYGGALLNKKVLSVGLGQNHTVAVSSEGEVYSWGSNAFGQLGYALPTTSPRDNEPVQLLPRQIFGPLKREIVLGAAASRTHSVVYTSTSLYTFGKNDGQLGLVDSDARSLEMQIIPRKVAASLFSSPIRMVSAIERATICLLENRDVWVFANYGWKKMMFPLDGINDFLKGNYSSMRYDSSANHITKISSGGDTICALAKTGDVFTAAVSQNVESCPAPTSTTNPAKIRGALSTPQRIWSLRKSHMAVRDVDVGQDGSIIICTESGSVWKRVKRAKIKDASSAPGSVEYRSKDYKFSRIPGLTRIIAVRSNTFGAFAAIRKDADVLRTQVEIGSSTLWKNLFPLLPFHQLSKEEDLDTEQPIPRLWTPQKPSDDAATIRHAVLTTKNLENDIEGIFTGSLEPFAFDLNIGTTVSGVRIPCHEFMVTGRSSFLRSALQKFFQSYYYTLPDVLTIEYDKQGKTLILFREIDFLTVFNLVFYIYTDSVVDVWHHTRHVQSMAFRYRQVRIELMKVAAQLDMRGLEHAVRLMVAPSRALHQDMKTAMLDAQFFETSNVLIELSDSYRKVHSALICQRCPFFDGLFHGRAGGTWLSSRRKDLQEPQETIKVDFKHVNSKVFDLVLRHVYSDVGEELFDDVVTSDFDTFLDLIMEVLSVANELMVDRLAQICQKALGQFANTRSVCQLLNAVAPCSVTEFKDAALEYICLNLEGMLENHLLDELDDDLMLELDEVVRQNQLACLPFARSGRAEALLHQQHPELAALLDRDRRVKVDSMALQSRLHEDEIKFTTGGKGKESAAEDARRSPNIQPLRHEASKGLGPPMTSPSLKLRASANDLMFDMDEDDDEDDNLEERGMVARQKQRHSSNVMEDYDFDAHESRTPASSLPTEDVWSDSKGKAFFPPDLDLGHGLLVDVGCASPAGRHVQVPSVHTNTANVTQSSGTKTPWKTTSFMSAKLDLKDIMAQTNSKSPSQVVSGLLNRAIPTDSVRSSSGAKLSQKERKKQLQHQQLGQGMIPSSPEVAPSGSIPVTEKPASPWRTASVGTRISLKDVLNDNTESPHRPHELASSQPQLTLRQTVPGNTVTSKKKSKERNSSVQTTQLRSVSSPNITIPAQSSPAIAHSRPSPQPHQAHPIGNSSASLSMPIRSIRHNPLPIEPSLQLSMADILSQQQTEKDIIKEAVAKRSLQEIQEEQAFQEWWDQEEAATKARLLEEEAAMKSRSGNRNRGGRTGRGKGRGGASRGVGRAERGGRGSSGSVVGAEK